MKWCITDEHSIVIMAGSCPGVTADDLSHIGGTPHIDVGDEVKLGGRWLDGVFTPQPEQPSGLATWNPATFAWDVVTPDPQTVRAEQIMLFSAAAQAHLDSVAWSWGYGDKAGPGCMDRAVTYVNSTNPQYKADAEALIAWRDALWACAFGVRAQFESGVLDAQGKTVADFLALLPAPPEKPIV
jgi:hypothetical protein